MVSRPEEYRDLKGKPLSISLAGIENEPSLVQLAKLIYEIAPEAALSTGRLTGVRRLYLEVLLIKVVTLIWHKSNHVTLEAHTIAVAELKNRYERSGEEPPRTLPLVEREERHRAQAARLAGLNTEAFLT